MTKIGGRHTLYHNCMIILAVVFAVALCFSGLFVSQNERPAEAATVTNTYDPVGGTVTGGNTQTVNSGASFTLPSVSRTGYRAPYWFDDTAKPGSYSPTGTAISTRAQLQNMSGSGSYYLTCSIDLSGSDWTPISSTFTGTFDGCGYMIKNMKITATSQYVGFFQRMRGTVKNVNFINVNINSSYSNTTSSYTRYVGGISGYSDSSNAKIINCTVSGTISGSCTTSYGSGASTSTIYVGGLMGRGYGEITNCYNTAKITASAYATNSSTETEGSGTANVFVGGLVGQSSSTITISNSFNTGTVSANGNGVVNYGTSYAYMYGYIGGIVGRAGSTTYINYCYNNGTLNTNLNAEQRQASTSSSYRAYTYTYCGGIVGYGKGTLIGCYNNGTINSKAYAYAPGYAYGYSYAGGIMGYNDSTVTMTYCHNLKSVNAYGYARYYSSSYDYNTSYKYGYGYAGGILGFKNTTATTNYCYNGGNVSGTAYSVYGTGRQYAYGYHMSSTSNPSMTGCYYNSSATLTGEDGTGNNGATATTDTATMASNHYTNIDATYKPDWIYTSGSTTYATLNILYPADLSGNAGDSKTNDGFNHAFKVIWTNNTYTVTYKINNGTGGSTANSSHTYDVAKSLTTNGFTREGYDFAGWSTNPVATSITYTNGQSVTNLTTTHNGTVTLHALWKSTVTLDRQNAVTGSTSVTTVENANMASATAPTMSGWTFMGYYTEPCGRGIQYYNGSMQSTHINDLVNGVTLYACWQSVLNLDVQGGTGITSVTATYNAPMPELAVPLRAGYTFGGYFAGKNGTATRYYTNTMASACPNNLPTGTTLYAYWIINTYALYYNPNGGTVNVSSASVSFGTTVAPPTPTRTGYTFFGWYIDGERYSGGVWTYTENKTATAKWGYILTYDANGGFVTTGSVSIIDGDTVSTPIPVRDGCTFVGWKIGSTPYNGGVWTFTTNQTAVAQWTCKLFATLNNGLEGSITGTTNGKYAPGSNISFTASPATGYIFDHWMINGSKVTTATYSGAINEHINAVAYFTKAQPTANVYATNGTIASTYLNFEPDTYSATLRITPEAGKYVDEISFDNVAFYKIDSWATKLYANSSFAQNVVYEANEGNNNLWLTFNHYDTNRVVNVYVKLTTTKYTNLSMPKNTDGGALDGIAVCANYGGSVTLVGADYEMLADTDTIICSAKLAQEGYEFVGWCFADAQANILSTEESARFEKSQIYGRQLMAKFQPTPDNPNYNMILDNQ